MLGVDWTSSMQQTFEFYKVNPISWYDDSLMENITSATIERDSSDETIVHATIDGENLLGEFYIRIYLIVIQNKVKYRIALGTFLIQTASFKFNGKNGINSVDAYSPLIELKEKMPPIGFYTPNDENIMNSAIYYAKTNMRAPIVQNDISTKRVSDSSGFVANFDDSWLTYISDLVSNVNFHLEVDENGRISFAPDQPISALQPVWTYTDDNSSILYPDISTNKDLYGIPNVVEVLYSSSTGNYLAVAKNENANSPVSIPSRGREIVHRTTSPDSLVMSKSQLDDYAQNLLENLSTIECSVAYTHGYCPVRIGDCVLIDYKKSGIRRLKAVVTSQSIVCDKGCVVSEVASFTTNLLRGDQNGSL